MPKPRLFEARYDFRQGRNSVVSPDLLNVSESVNLNNTRIDTIYGGVTKRTGSQRIHPTSMSALSGTSTTTGLFQWDSPASGTKELIIIHGTAAASFCHKTSALGDPTCTAPATAFAGVRQSFAVNRNALSSGTALRLYIAGNVLYKWDGTTISVITPTGLPSDVDLLASHATRMFAHSPSWKKNLYWSAVGDAENFLASGLPTDAGTGVVDTMSENTINSLEVLASSLMIGTQQSVSRFTGSNTSNIQLSTDTNGISTDLGPAGVLAIKRFETAIALLSRNQGPFILTDTGLAPIGLKVLPDFLATANPATIANAAIGYHRGRKELWFGLPDATGAFNTVYVYSTILQAWMGPWVYPYYMTTFASYVDPTTGADNLISGGNDGWIRIMDTPGSYLDDVHSDGSGGLYPTMTWEPAPHFFGIGPGLVKNLDRMKLDARIPLNSSLTLTAYGDTQKDVIVIPSKEYKNLLIGTESIGQAPWAGAGYTYTQNAVSGPNGSINGTRVADTGPYPTEIGYQNFVASQSGSLIYTGYVKNDTVAANVALSEVFALFNTATANLLGFITLAFDSVGNGYINASGGATLAFARAYPANTPGWTKLVVAINGGWTPGDIIRAYIPAGATALLNQSLFFAEPMVTYGTEEKDYIVSGSTQGVSGILEYRVDLDVQGRRSKIEFNDSYGAQATDATAIYGYSLEAFQMGRDDQR